MSRRNRNILLAALVARAMAIALVLILVSVLGSELRQGERARDDDWPSP
jgi:hypothetical protein